MTDLIKVENISFEYETDESVFEGLEDFSVCFKEGEFTSVLGHNGSGKSTLAKLLNGLLVPKSGTVTVDGLITSDQKNDISIKRKVGMVFQNPDNQLVATVVEEDVAFGPENLGLPREEIRCRVDSSLAMVGMSEYARHAPHKLSGGQKQRVAIAGIIAMKPQIIIFDESTAMLDPLGRREVIEIMERLNKEENITVINITHYMDEAARADRVIVINDGEITHDGTAKEVFSEVGRLHELGLEAPQGRELISQLSELGINVNTDALSEEECTDALIKYLKV